MRAIERCPKCNRAHEIGPYFIQREGDRKVFSPNDIECACGLTLRPVVPIFKETDSGYRLVPKPDSEPLRASTEEP